MTIERRLLSPAASGTSTPVPPVAISVARYSSQVLTPGTPAGINFVDGGDDFGAWPTDDGTVLDITTNTTVVKPLEAGAYDVFAYFELDVDDPEVGVILTCGGVQFSGNYSVKAAPAPQDGLTVTGFFYVPDSLATGGAGLTVTSSVAEAVTFATLAVVRR